MPASRTHLFPEAWAKSWQTSHLIRKRTLRKKFQGCLEPFGLNLRNNESISCGVIMPVSDKPRRDNCLPFPIKRIRGGRDEGFGIMLVNIGFLCAVLFPGSATRRSKAAGIHARYGDRRNGRASQAGHDG